MTEQKHFSLMHVHTLSADELMTHLKRLKRFNFNAMTPEELRDIGLWIYAAATRLSQVMRGEPLEPSTLAEFTLEEGTDEGDPD